MLPGSSGGASELWLVAKRDGLANIFFFFFLSQQNYDWLLSFFATTTSLTKRKLYPAVRLPVQIPFFPRGS